MASPQRENGHTDIANELLEQLYAFPFSARELKVILFVIRKTWGWNKKEDIISNGQIAKATKIDRPHVVEVVGGLVAKKVLVVAKTVLGKMQVNKIRLNKDYESWTSTKSATSGQDGTRVVAKMVLPPQEDKLVPNQPPTNTKTISIKTTITKTNNTNATISLFKDINPHYEMFFKNKTQRAAVDRLLQRYSVDQLKAAVFVARSFLDQPYKPKVTTPVQLESEWAKLAAHWKTKDGDNKYQSATFIRKGKE